MIELEERAREGRRGGPAQGKAAKLSDVARALLESPAPSSSSRARPPSSSRAAGESAWDWDWDSDAESNEAPAEAAEEDDSPGQPPLRPAEQAEEPKGPSEEGPEGPAVTLGGNGPRRSPPGPAGATRSTPADPPAATSGEVAWVGGPRPPTPDALANSDPTVSRLTASSDVGTEPAPVEAARRHDVPDQHGVPRAAAETTATTAEATTSGHRWSALDVAGGEETGEVMTEREYEAREGHSEAVEDWASADDVGLESYGDDAGADAWTSSQAGSVHERLPRPEYRSREYVYDADWDEEPEDEDEDDGYATAGERSMVEDPRRRAFYHRGSDDDHHHRPRRKRDPDRNPAGKPAFAHAGAALGAFVGLSLFIIVLATISIIAGAAAIIKEDQAHPGNPPGIPLPAPAPGKKQPGQHPGRRPPVVVPVPPVLVPPPVEVPPVVVPVPPVVVPPVAVPPVVLPPVVVPPHKTPPARRPGPSRPPTRRKGTPGPPNRKPGRKPTQPKLPYCKNTKVNVSTVWWLPDDIPEEFLDPGSALTGVPGICQADPPGSSGPGGGVAGTISKVTPNNGGKTKVTLDAVISRPIQATTVSTVTSSATGLLASDQQLFGARLAADTGLNPQVVAAWMLAEESGGAAQSRQQANNNNWLNIGYFDSGTGAIAFDNAFSGAISGADQTARFLEGTWGGATTSSTTCGNSTGIRGILTTVGQPPQAQIAAIQRSGWATSCYPDLPLTYQLVTGIKLPNVGVGNVVLTSSTGGSLTLAELTSKLPTLTQADFAHLTSQDLENALPQLEAALGVSGVQTTGEQLPIGGLTGGGPAGAQKMLAAARAVLGSTYNQGNHDAVLDSPATIMQLGTDCSGFVSYLMGPNGAGLWSQSYATNTMSTAPGLQPGTGTAGHYVTIYNNPLPGNAGHVFIDIKGYWFEDNGQDGARQMSSDDVKNYLDNGLYTQVFHPAGM